MAMRFGLSLGVLFVVLVALQSLADGAEEETLDEVLEGRRGGIGSMTTQGTFRIGGISLNRRVFCANSASMRSLAPRTPPFFPLTPSPAACEGREYGGQG